MNEEPRHMILHLYQDIPYHTCDIAPTEIAMTYGQLLSLMDTSPVGMEGCINGRFSRSEDSIVFTAEQVGVADPPTPQMRKATEEGRAVEIELGADSAFCVHPGTYIFSQLAWTPDMSNLIIALMPIFSAPNELSLNEGTFYIRLIKENALEVVVQILCPLGH